MQTCSILQEMVEAVMHNYLPVFISQGRGDDAQSVMWFNWPLKSFTRDPAFLKVVQIGG
jgi:hypothetical protein